MAALRGCAGRGKSGLHGGTVPGNPRRGRPQGKCHRKYTASPSPACRMGGKGETVRQERTAPPATAAAGKTPPGARPSRSGRRRGVIRCAGRASAPPLGSVARGARRRASQRNGHHRPQRLRLRAGQNPAYTPSGARSTVDASADQIGISAVSGGQPCGSPNSLLRVEADRVASLIVWSTRSLSRL